jgi:hypothetical protein
MERKELLEIAYDEIGIVVGELRDLLHRLFECFDGKPAAARNTDTGLVVEPIAQPKIANLLFRLPSRGCGRFRRGHRHK